MLFALPRLFILSICVTCLNGNDVTERNTEASTTSHYQLIRYSDLESVPDSRGALTSESRCVNYLNLKSECSKHWLQASFSAKGAIIPNKINVQIHFASATARPLAHRNNTKVTRNDQLLSLLATRRRQIIENRFKTHIKNIVELAKNGTNVTKKHEVLPNNLTAVNIHLKLSDLLQNSLNASSHESTNTEINLVNVSSPKNSQNNRKHVGINASQISENKNNTKNLPIIRNILFRRKMSYLNRKLPLDFDQIAYDTLGLSEIGKTPDDLVMDAEDSLQVEESSHDKLIYYDVKNNSSKNSMNNFDDVSEETKALSLINKTYHHEKPDVTTDKDEYIIVRDKSENKTITEKNITKPNTTLETENKFQKIRLKDKTAKNNTHFMSQSLYNYFRPPEDVPEEEMQPFLHFGEKIPVTKQNVSKNQSLKPTLTPKLDEVTQKHEEEVDENMDVSVTKPIYENKIPKMILPNQKTNVVQQYMKNRSYNISKAAESRNLTKSEKKSPVLNIPKLRNSSRNRGFRNRTIFFHQKRNGMRQTINLHPNSSIADLKPIEYITDVTNESISNVNNSSEKMTLKNTSLPQKNETLPETKNITIVTNTSTEILTKVEKTELKTTEKMQKMTELTTVPTTRKISTTIIVPTTRILATDVVTSISIKSSISDTANKTRNNTLKQDKSERNTADVTDPEATVITILNNYTSQSFNKNLTTSRNFTRPIYHEIRRSSTKTETVAVQKPTPVFYLNKTDFIIHVPDVETTTAEFASENTTEIVETATNTQIFDDISINTRFKDVTEKDITNTMTSTIRSKTPGTTTIKHAFNELINVTTETALNKVQVTTDFIKRISPTQTTEQTQKTTEKTKVPTTEGKKMLNFSLTNSESASELPLATLFNVIDFKKTEPKNTTSLPKVIPGTETVISKKNDNSSTFDNVHAAYILASLGLIPMAVIVIYVIRNVMKRKNKCFEDFEAELQDDKANIITPVARLPALVHVDSPTKWEFPRSKLRLQTLLGQGNFGQVWKAEADDLKGHIGLTRLVAVKTIKDGAGSKDREDLLKELAIMQKMGSHPNVVTLLGCCTEKEPYLLIMEYVMYGKLLTYLRDHRTRQDYFNFSDDAATLTARDLTVFAYCVARGMEYLGTKGIIHRDLAARNILVDHNKLCKIADFGMSRDCHGDEEITEPRQPRNALPVRWMAIESLLYSVFTFKTDVWSFGVLLWEIVTLGSSPYANMSGREVMRLICDGYRLERPNHCKPELYNVMARTWHVDSDQRPTFAELRTELAEMLENTAAEGSYVDLESFRADSTVYEIDNCTPRGNYFTVKSRFSEFECDI